jgi:hypothetical protein
MQTLPADSKAGMDQKPASTQIIVFLIFAEKMDCPKPLLLLIKQIPCTIENSFCPES